MKDMLLNLLLDLLINTIQILGRSFWISSYIDNEVVKIDNGFVDDLKLELSVDLCSLEG